MTIGGIITVVKIHVTAKGNKMAFITLETLNGSCEVTIFADTFEQRAGLIFQDMLVMIPARVSFRNNTPGLVASDVMAIEDAEKTLTRAVHVRLQTMGLDETLVEELAQILGRAPGRCDVFLHCMTPENSDVVIQATSVCKVAPTDSLREKVEQLLGMDTIWFAGANPLAFPS